MRLTGMRLPGNASRTKPAPLGFGRVENGLKMPDSEPLGLRVCEKSPDRSRSVGIELSAVEGEPCRSPSYPPKKNNFFERQMGPAKFPPNWLRWKRVLARPLRLFDQEFASSAELRRKSNTVPWKSELPPFVTTLTMPPPERPYCASYALRITCTSATESIAGEISRPFQLLPAEALTPSSNTPVVVLRPPLRPKRSWFWSATDCEMPVAGAVPP